MRVIRNLPRFKIGSRVSICNRYHGIVFFRYYTMAGWIYKVFYYQMKPFSFGTEDYHEFVLEGI